MCYPTIRQINTLAKHTTDLKYTFMSRNLFECHQTIKYNQLNIIVTLLHHQFNVTLSSSLKIKQLIRQNPY